MSADQVSVPCVNVNPDALAHAELEWVFDPAGFPVNRGRLEARGVSSRSTTHEQRWVGHLDGSGALVDVCLAPTIAALWVPLVDTSFSCQGSNSDWRYVVARATHRFLAADVLARLGERLVEQNGHDGRWLFQLSHSPFSLLRHGRDWWTTTNPRWDLP